MKASNVWKISIHKLYGKTTKTVDPIVRLGLNHSLVPSQKRWFQWLKTYFCSWYWFTICHFWSQFKVPTCQFLITIIHSFRTLESLDFWLIVISNSHNFNKSLLFKIYYYVRKLLTFTGVPEFHSNTIRVHLTVCHKLTSRPIMFQNK